jgi:type III secretory pathway component EscV
MGDGGATIYVFRTFGIGAWIMAICMVVMIVLSVIQFLGIKTGVSIIDEAASKSNIEKEDE